MAGGSNESTLVAFQEYCEMDSDLIEIAPASSDRNFILTAWEWSLLSYWIRFISHNIIIIQLSFMGKYSTVRFTARSYHREERTDFGEWTGELPIDPFALDTHIIPNGSSHKTLFDGRANMRKINTKHVPKL